MRKEPGTDYCPFCNKVVAPQEFGKVINKHGVFHHGCWILAEKIQKLNELPYWKN